MSGVSIQENKCPRAIPAAKPFGLPVSFLSRPVAETEIWHKRAGNPAIHATGDKPETTQPRHLRKLHQRTRQQSQPMRNPPNPATSDQRHGYPRVIAAIRQTRIEMKPAPPTNAGMPGIFQHPHPPEAPHDAASPKGIANPDDLMHL